MRKHFLTVYRRVMPFLALFIHLSAVCTTAGTEVERLCPQDKFLDKLLDERAAISTEHADVQSVSLDIAHGYTQNRASMMSLY